MRVLQGLGLLAVMAGAAAGSSSWVACSNTFINIDGGVAGDSGAPAPVDGGIAPLDGGDGGGADDGSAPDDAAMAPLTCASYCTAITAACTGGSAQYLSNDECMNACSLWTVGAITDLAVSSLGCRMAQTGLAATTPNPSCWNAGPFAPQCGGTCADFCATTLAWCSPADGYDGGPDYDGSTDCTTDCAGYALADAGGLPNAFNAAGPQTGNTLDCRLWHLSNALSGAPGSAEQALHCPHAEENSAACQ